MIPAEYYQNIYLLFVLVISVFSLPNYKINSHLYSRSKSVNSIVVLIGVILFIGLRPLSHVFADMSQYAGYLYQLQGSQFFFNWDAENLIYDNLMSYLACKAVPYTLFYVLIASIYFGCYYICIRKIFTNDYSIMLILFLSAFMTFTSSTNGIKAGAATAIFMVAIAYYQNWKVWLPILLISFGFHHAMQLPIAAFLCSKVVKNHKVYFGIWLFCLVCAVFHITAFQSVFANFTDEKGASYLIGGGEWGGRAGFRIDFVAYSAMPIIVGWYAIIKKNIADTFYKNILNIYMLSNGIWMLCMYINYNNRIAALSWGMYVVVLFYPILCCSWPGNRNHIFRNMAWAHIGFTLFMHFIYYGFIHLVR